MKRIFLLLSLLTVFIMIFLSSCEYATHIGDMIGGVISDEQGGESTDHNNEDINDKNDAEIHTHDYSVRDTSEIYLKSSATCTDAAAYYFSCSCGKRGAETFFGGEALGHILARAKCGESMYCSVCGVKSNKLTEHIWNIAEDGKSQTCSSCGMLVDLEEHVHTWIDATCTSPKTCSVCSTTEGSPLQHEWQEATCQALKTCLLCQTTEGELEDHNFVNNSCTICGYPEKTDYIVKVVTAGGMPLNGVFVYVHNVDGYGVCAPPTETDDSGVAKFTLYTSDEYSVELQGAPDGYEVKGGATKDDRYSMTSEYTEIVLTSAPITTGGLKSSYNLGDVMYDFTLTDVNGKSYKLSELLGEKDMVMLNFWFATCGPCRREFPYINTVYKEFMDEVEILAINDYDTKADILSYSESFSEKLIIPMFTNGDLSLSNFPSIGYPTTVIIDRYGVICMIEVGAVTGETPWRNLFEHFTADEYEQKLLEGIDSV